MRRVFLGAALAITLVCSGRATALQSPERGSIAPAISLEDTSGAKVSTASMAGKTLVLIFGELDQDRTQLACADVLAVVSLQRFDADAVVPMLIVGKAVPAAGLKDEAKARQTPRVVLQDPERVAFEAYHVIVLPTVVVVDGKGRVVYTLPVHLANFKELLTDSILCATGKMSDAEFAAALDPRSGGGESPERIKADRLVRLGQELARHGMTAEAEAKLREALAVQARSIDAMLALGDVLLAQGKLPDAAAQFRKVREMLPESVDAGLGIAAVEIRQGGEGLKRAEAALEKLLANDQHLARARFLMGQIKEQRGECDKAMAEYKAAAQIMLER